MEPQKQSKQLRICQFYVQRKKRQCKFKAIKGSKFCSSHCSDIEGKIQCPFQTGVYLDINNYDNHMEICPKIKEKKKVAESVWFQKDVNYSNKAPKGQQIQKMQHQSMLLLSSIQPQKIENVTRIAITIYLQKFKQQKLIKFVSSTPEQNLPGMTNDHKQAFLLAQIGQNHNLIRNNVIYVQFGAGKGILSYSIAKKVEQVTKKQSKNILLERQSRRNKFDKHFRNNPFFQRYKSDVSDFSIKMLSKTILETIKSKINKNNNQYPEINLKEAELQLQNCKIVGICKHMCGGALDISLRALLQGNHGGCIMASCCHHLCSYQTYLNVDFFKNYKMTEDQIQLLFKLSSWGTKSTFIDPNEVNFFQLSKKKLTELKEYQKVIIGRICKRLIDLGRVEFINGELVKYCSDQLTPQNYAIVYEKNN